MTEPRIFPAGGGGGASFSGFTDGSVIFVESEGAQEDNANFFWDDTEDMLSIGDNAGGQLPASLSGAAGNYDQNFLVHHDDAVKSILGIEASFIRHDTGAAVAKSNFFLARSRGTPTSPAAISSGDGLGAILYGGYDGSHYKQQGEISVSAGATADSGRMKFRIQKGGTFDNIFGLHEDGYTVVGDIDSASGNFVSGADSLLIQQDLEVQNQTRFDGQIGWQMDPENASAFAADYSSGTIAQFFRIDKITTISSAPPSSGINVLNFSLSDESTVNNATFRAVRHSAQYNRAQGTHPTNNTLACVEVFGYGPSTSVNITASGSTFNWNGFVINPFDPAGSSNIQDTTVNMRGLQINQPVYARYQDLMLVGSETYNYLAIEAEGAMTLGELRTYRTQSGIGTDTVADGEAASIKMDPSYSRSGSIGVRALDIERHNYIKMENPSSSNMGTGGAVNNACSIWFDADPGTHLALDSGTSKSTPGTVDAWEKKNLNGNIYYSPLYTGKL